MKEDKHYTPERVAEIALTPIRRQPETVADFAVGGGMLLRAVGGAGRNARFIGTDISSSTVRALRPEFPDAMLGVCNFLNSQSRFRCHALAKAR